MSLEAMCFLLDRYALVNTKELYTDAERKM